MHNNAALLPVGANDDVQQGDLFRAITSLDDLSNESDESQFYLILSADCDIAQNKLDSCFTILPIITAERWIETVWADQRCDQVLDKALNKLSERLWAHDKQRDPAVSRLSRAEVKRYVVESTPEEIEAAFAADAAFAKYVSKQAGALKALIQSQAANQHLRGWLAWSETQEGSRKVAVSQLRDALSTMRTGYFFLPELPGRGGLGHVVMLRDVRAAPLENVFRRAIDIRHTSAKPPYFLRAGRLSDTVRFAIAQQVAMLFSRVGLSTQFEEECEFARDAASEAILARLGLIDV